MTAPHSFIDGVRKQLQNGKKPPAWLSADIGADASPLPSSVLFLLSPRCTGPESGFRPCLILNKRSRQVRQPGDLCCPGGGLSPRIDPFFARILGLPGLPLRRWPHWRTWRRKQPGAARALGLLMAASLREGFEEMRLNPLFVTFLGALPPQRLVMFQREIFPMVGWTDRQRRFYPNWEVEKIIRIPLDALLTAANYGRYRIGYRQGDSNVIREHPCFVHRSGDETELLWGATFRIVMTFLETVFGFFPPDPAGLPPVSGKLDRDYFAAPDRMRSG